MKHINSIKDIDTLKAVVVQELKSYNIKINFRKSRHDFRPSRFRFTKINTAPTRTLDVIGTDLERINSVPVVLPDDKIVVEVPFFFTVMIDYLRKYIKVEGILRKEGVMKRECEILFGSLRIDNANHTRRKKKFDKDGLTKNIVDGKFDFQTSNVFDICCIMKRFLRNVPGGTVPLRFYDMLLECTYLDDETMTHCILSVCLLFPKANLDLIIYLMRFLKDVSEQSAQNGMSVDNIAIVLAPSLINNADRKIESLTFERKVVVALVKNAYKIGYVTDSTYNLAAIQSAAAAAAASRNCKRTDPYISSLFYPERKRRSSSLKGMLSSLHSSFTKLRRRSLSSSTNDDFRSVIRNKFSNTNNKSFKPKDTCSSSMEMQQLRGNFCYPLFRENKNRSTTTAAFAKCISVPAVSSLKHPDQKLSSFNTDGLTKEASMDLLTRGANTTIDEILPCDVDEANKSNEGVVSSSPSDDDDEYSVGILDTARIEEVEDESDDICCEKAGVVVAAASGANEAVSRSNEEEKSTQRPAISGCERNNKRACLTRPPKRLTSLLCKKGAMAGAAAAAAAGRRHDLCKLLNHKNRLEIIRRMINENMVTPVSLKSSSLFSRLIKGSGSPTEASDFVGQLDFCKNRNKRRTSSFSSSSKTKLFRERNPPQRHCLFPSRMSPHLNGINCNLMSVAKNNFGEEI